MPGPALPALMKKPPYGWPVRGLIDHKRRYERPWFCLWGLCWTYLKPTVMYSKLQRFKHLIIRETLAGFRRPAQL